MSLMTYNWVYL